VSYPAAPAAAPPAPEAGAPLLDSGEPPLDSGEPPLAVPPASPVDPPVPSSLGTHSQLPLLELQL
jgi:hypothetical protein